MEQQAEIVFSVIIPTYNRKAFLAIAIDSVLAQTYKQYELIIIDNNSSDGTGELIRSYGSRVAKYLTVNNHGSIGLSRNAGIFAATGDWICFLDSDDWWYPNKLACIRKYTSLGDVIYHDLCVYSATGRRTAKIMKTRLLHPPIGNSLLVGGSCIANSGAAVRRRTAVAVGGFCEDVQLAGAEDFDFWIRVGSSTHKFICIQRALGAYRSSPDSVSKGSKSQIIALEKVYQRNFNILNSQVDKHAANMSLAYYKACILFQMKYYRQAMLFFHRSRSHSNLRLAISSLVKIFICKVMLLARGNR